MFEVEGETYCWEDVILAATRSGQWAALQQGTREALALAARLERDDEPEPEEEIEETASQFRYDRDLLRADDMEEWLAGRGVTVEEWMDMIRREVLRRRAGDDLEDSMAEWDPDPGQLAEAVRVELALRECRRSAGARPRRAGSRCCRGAAWGQAQADRGPDQRGRRLTSSNPIPQRKRRPRRSVIRPSPVWPRSAARAAAGSLDRLERDWARFQESLTGPGGHRSRGESPPARLAEVRLLRPSALPTSPQAREAALCIREDGLSIEQVADDAHEPVTESAVPAR